MTLVDPASPLGAATLLPPALVAAAGAARRVVVVTGAGISAASGVATYRERGSGWTDQDLERLSRGPVFGNHLDRLWPFWSALRATTAAAQPNAAHLALAGWHDRLADTGELLVVTQNVDGLHQRAGSHTVVELHGSVHSSRCLRTGCRWQGPDTRLLRAPATQLRCPVCAGKLRPAVVLFEEALPAGPLRTVQQALRRADLCVYVGTSGNVWPVSELLTVARRAGAVCALLNAEPWAHPHPDFAHTVLGQADVLLPALLEASRCG